MGGLLCVAIAWAHTIVATLSVRCAVMPLQRTLWQLAASPASPLRREAGEGGGPRCGTAAGRRPGAFVRVE